MRRGITCRLNKEFNACQAESHVNYVDSLALLYIGLNCSNPGLHLSAPGSPRFFSGAADHSSLSLRTELKMAPSSNADMFILSEEGVFIAPDVKSDGAYMS